MRRILLSAALGLPLANAGCECGAAHSRDAGAVSADAAVSAADEVRAFCNARASSPRSCTPDCYAAIDEALSACRAERDALSASSELPLLLDCAMACTLGLDCPGRPALVECECADRCLRARSESLQEAFRAETRCTDAIIGPRCYR
ncbi:MAG: hypothetical protein U0234_18560 [Sandaracinus sp.]